MISPEHALDAAAAAVERAITMGASAADAVFSASADSHVQVRLGQLEDVGQSESQTLSLRVFVGQRAASVSATQYDSASLADLCERALAIARLAPRDDFVALAPEELLDQDPPPDLDLADDTILPNAAMRDMAMAAEDAARSVAGVTNSEGAGVSRSETVSALATSHGFNRAARGTSFSCGVSVLAGSGGDMQRDHGSRTTRHLADMEPPEALGLLAGTRAVARLNPGRVRSGPMPVVFDPRVGGSLLGHLIAGISGSAIARRTSFLLDALDTQVFAPGITAVDNPLALRGLRSRANDGEGLRTRRSLLIDKGVLTGWMLDATSALQLGMTPTGHAAGGGTSASNVHIEPGAQSLAELIADIAHGVLVTELIGHGVSTVTGDYSRGASGFLIERGEIIGPVAEFTIAGNLRDMFAGLRAADDLAMHRAFNVPSLRTDAMTVASGG